MVSRIRWTASLRASTWSFVAAVIATDGDVDLSALRQELKREISAYKIPRRIIAVAPAQIPVLSSGKVDMSRLATVFDD